MDNAAHGVIEIPLSDENSIWSREYDCLGKQRDENEDTAQRDRSFHGSTSATTLVSMRQIRTTRSPQRKVLFHPVDGSAMPVVD